MWSRLPAISVSRRESALAWSKEERNVTITSLGGRFREYKWGGGGGSEVFGGFQEKRRRRSTVVSIRPVCVNVEMASCVRDFVICEQL